MPASRPPTDILEELRDDGGFTNFVRLIEAAELGLLFSTVSPITVFAADASRRWR